MMIKKKNLLIALFFLASCSNESSYEQQNLSELIQPDLNYFSSQYDCSLLGANNLNDLEQYIPKLSALLKNHSFKYQLEFYFADNQKNEIKSFIINVKNSQVIDREKLGLFINSENEIFQCLQKNNNLIATTLISKLDIQNSIFYLEILDCEFSSDSNFGTFKVASDYFFNLLNEYSIAYKADFLNSDSDSRNFYWHNLFNSPEDRDDFFANWVGSDESIEIKELFSGQSECFSSNSYIGYKVY